MKPMYYGFVLVTLTRGWSLSAFGTWSISSPGGALSRQLRRAIVQVVLLQVKLFINLVPIFSNAEFVELNVPFRDMSRS